MRAAAPAVAAVLVVLLAGCSGGGPSPDAGPGPEPGPESEAVTATPEFPPGVTADGLQNAEALVRAHTESVRERGATLSWNATATIAVDGEARTIDFETAAWSSPNAAEVYYDTDTVRVGSKSTLRAERVQVYADETTVYTRHVLDGNVSTVATDPRGDRGDLVSLHVARAGLVKRVLEGGAFEVVEAEERDGTTVTTLEAFEEAFTDRGRRVFHATVRVAADGRILSLSVRRNPDANTEPGGRTSNATWTAPPDPETPEWVQ